MMKYLPTFTAPLILFFLKGCLPKLTANLNLKRLSVVMLISIAAPLTHVSAANIVLASNGGVLESFTSEWDNNFAAALLTDGVTNQDGWASEQNPGPQEFVYSFSGGADAELIDAVIHGGTAEGFYYSRNVEVWTSDDGGANYTLRGNDTLAQADNDSVTINLGNVTANRVKLVITSGYRTDWWELAEFVVNSNSSLPAPPTGLNYDFSSSGQSSIAELENGSWTFRNGSRERIATQSGDAYLRVGGRNRNDPRATLDFGETWAEGKMTFTVSSGNQSPDADFEIRGGGQDLMIVNLLRDTISVTHSSGTDTYNGEEFRLSQGYDKRVTVTLTWTVEDDGSNGVFSYDISQNDAANPDPLLTGVISNLSFINDGVPDELRINNNNRGNNNQWYALYDLSVKENLLITEYPNDAGGPLIVMDANLRINDEDSSGNSTNLYVGGTSVLDGDVIITGNVTGIDIFDSGSDPDFTDTDVTINNGNLKVDSIQDSSGTANIITTNTTGITNLVFSDTSSITTANGMLVYDMTQAAGFRPLLGGDKSGNARAGRSIDIQTIRAANDEITSGRNSVSVGNYNKTDGVAAVSLGLELENYTHYNVAIGRYPDTSGTQGDSRSAWHNADPIFTVGNGRFDSGSGTRIYSNALTILKNGNADVGGTLNATLGVNTPVIRDAAGTDVATINSGEVTFNGPVRLSAPQGDIPSL